MYVWGKIFLTGFFLSSLSIEVSTFTCSQILKLWTEQNCSSVSRYSHYTKCLSMPSKSINVVIKNNSISVFECMKKLAPDIGIYQCIDVKFKSLKIENCNFKKEFFMSDFLQGNEPVLVMITAYSKKIMPLYVTFSNMPSLLTITIFSYYTGGKFNIQMEQLESLSTLHIIQHDISKFPKMPFKNLENLRNLVIREGYLSSLPNNLFVGLNNLNILDLSRNKITIIDNSTFKHLHYLYMLDLSDNKISTIQIDSLAFLKKLNTLRLTRNELSEVPENFFVDLPTLSDVDISGNLKLKEFPDRFFTGVKKLKEFSVSHCSLKTISHTLFLGISPPTSNNIQSGIHLRELVVKKNVTNFVKCNSNKVIRYLDMEGLKESKFPGQTVKQQPNEIIGNVWQYFTTLYMSYNQLSTIYDATFEPLVSLEQLYLSNNLLHTLPQNMPFGPSKNLSFVVIRSCKLSELPKIDWSKHDLKMVDLSSNAIKEVHLPIFIRTRTTIILSYNQISVIHVKHSRYWKNSPLYYLEGNNPNCDCNMEPFLRYLRFDKNKSNPVFPDANIVKCKKSQISEPLTEVWPEHLSCPIMDCPNKCNCTTIEWEKMYVDCSSLNLFQVPNVIPYATATVNLDNNMIPSISSVITKEWQGVANIILKNNVLQTIDDGAIPASVRRLELSNNRLKSIPFTLMMKVSSFPDFTILLAGNPWSCNCDSFPFIEWWKENYDKILDYETAYCSILSSENDNISQISMLSISRDDICNSYTAQVLAGKYILYPVSLLMAILCLTYIVHKYRHSILALMHAYDVYPSLLDRNMIYIKKKFDAFVCYAPEDSRVYKKIHHKIKTQYRFYKMKLTEMGRLEDRKILRALKRSRFIILLVSERFIDRFILYKIGKAFHQMTNTRLRHVILVFIDNINTKALPNRIEMILSAEYKLRWKEALFWTKLRYFLRVPPNRPSASSTRKK